MKDAELRDIGQALPMQLLRAREAAMAHFRPMLRQHGLTEQQWRVVRVVAAFPALDASELALRSSLLAPSLSRITQHLINSGVLRRQADSNDQRRYCYLLTAKGQRLFAAVAPDSEQIYADITARFGANKLARLNALLDELSASLEATGEELSEVT